MQNSWSQQPKPMLKPIERGREFHPKYETSLADFDVDTGEWEHVCSARFGPGRLCEWSTTTKWTGDSYRYDIFRKPWRVHKGDQYAVRWWNGGGEGWLFISEPRYGEHSLVVRIAEEPIEERRWDYCHFLWQVAEKTARAANCAEHQRMATAFVDGRLKKRRKGGKVFVDVIDPEPCPAVET